MYNIKGETSILLQFHENKNTYEIHGFESPCLAPGLANYGHFAPWLDRSNQKLERSIQAGFVTSANQVRLGSGWKNDE